MVLKQGLEIGMKKLGAKFKNCDSKNQQQNQKNFIDGSVEIMQQQQIIEQLKQKIEALEDKYQTAESKNHE